MATNGGPNIIQDGLIFAVDAANKKSYTSGSDTWVDLAGSNDGTLENNPTFTTENGGGFVFDGTDDYIEFGTEQDYSSELTIDMWVKYNSTANLHCIQKRASHNTAVFFLGGTGTGAYRWRTGQGATSTATLDSSTGTMIQGELVNIVATYNTTINDKRIYKNGVSIANTTTSGNLYNQSSSPLRLGTDDRNIAYFNGEFYYIRMYNKGLSQSEITQNYNALKSRFGL